MNALTTDVLRVVSACFDYDGVRAALADPAAVVPSTALAPLLAALSASMVTGDLLGRYQVVREAAAQRVTIAPIEHAFPGQAAFSDGPTGPTSPTGRTLLVPEPLPPQEAIDLFKSKLPMTTTAFNEISDIYRGRAFTIAKQQTVDAVATVQDWLTKSLEDGSTFRDFLGGLSEAAAAGGISAVNPYHAATVFVTNIQTAYNAGRWEMYNAPSVVDAFPYFQYHTVGDDRVRPTHAQMDGYIARRDDPVWNLWWPPNGFNCRCTCTAISKYEIQDRGIRPSRRQVPNPDPGFAGNAALAIRTAGLAGANVL